MKQSADSGLADRLFSIYIRLRDTDENGRGVCITCNEPKKWNELSCGHFIKRRHNLLRWEPKNCFAQCIPCNMEDNEKKFEQKLIQRYGKQYVSELKQLKNHHVKFFNYQIINLIKLYRLKCHLLLKEKNFHISIP